MSEKKLRLNKETIRNLSDESLDQVAGGKKKDLSVLCNTRGGGNTCGVVINTCGQGNSCALVCSIVGCTVICG